MRLSTIVGSCYYVAPEVSPPAVHTACEPVRLVTEYSKSYPDAWVPYTGAEAHERRCYPVALLMQEMCLPPRLSATWVARQKCPVQ